MVVGDENYDTEAATGLAKMNSEKNPELTRLDSTGRCNALEELAIHFLQSDGSIRLDAFKERGFIVLPIESMGYIDENAERRLVQGFANLGYSTFDAILAEHRDQPGPMPKCVRVQVSPGGLRSFAWECGIFDYFAAAPDDALVALFTTGDYILIAGALPTLLRFERREIETYFFEFLKFVNSPVNMGGPAHRFYMDLYEKCYALYRA